MAFRPPGRSRGSSATPPVETGPLLDGADGEGSVDDHGDPACDEPIAIAVVTGEEARDPDLVFAYPVGVEAQGLKPGLSLIEDPFSIVGVGPASELAHQDFPDQVVVLPVRGDAVADLGEAPSLFNG